MIFGKEKIAKILSRLKVQDSKKILDTITAKNSQLADEIRELMFSFEDILDLSTKDIELLHKRVETHDLLLAMKGAGHEFREKLFSGISNNRKMMLNEELELMGKVKRSDVETACQRMMDIIHEMIGAGEIFFDDEWVE